MTVASSSFINKEDLKWEIPTEPANLGPTFYVSSNNGIFIMLQMIYSSLNSWSPSVQLTARVYGPNDLKKQFSLSESGSSLVISEDRLSSRCGPMNFKALETSNIGYHIVCKTDSLLIDFKTEAMADGFQIGDGKHHYSDETPEHGWIKSKFIPRSIAKGVVIVDGAFYEIDGISTMTFVTQVSPQNVARFNFCSFQNDDVSLMLYQFHLPPGGSKSQVSQASFVLNDKIEAITLENRTVFHKVEFDGFSSHEIPTALTHEWAGQTIDGQNIGITLSLDLRNLVDKIDVLGELPYLLKVFIQTFVTAPYVYQWIEDAKIVVKVGDKVSEFTGRVFHETTFMLNIE